MGDWVIFTYSREVEANKKIRDIYTKHDPVGYTTSITTNGRRLRKRYIKGWEKRLDSGVHESATLEEIRAIEEPGGSSGVYDNKASVEGVIRELGEGDFGYCTVVAGIFDEVLDVSRKAPVAYSHTINMSAETFGRLELLPEPKVLEIVTMCGHAFISSYLVDHLAGQVKAGRMSAEDAAVELGKQCTCNFFNVVRGAKLINEYNA
jgi:hypothetical protein